MKEDSNPAAGEHPRGPRLLFLAALFAVLLNYPLLAIVDHNGRWCASSKQDVGPSV
jgi:hypothetical protein